MINCLFSHYGISEIPNYVFYYLEKLKPFCDIYFLTNKRNISNEEILEHIGIPIYKYENEGYDFGMYYNFLKDNPISGDLLLVNDSMVAFNKLDDIFRNIIKTDSDLYGITISNEVERHLQSYFWYMKEDIFEIFKNYLNVNKVKNNIHDVINTYEIGFCKILLNNNYKIDAIYKSNNKYNPTIHNDNWSSLINKDIPLIKKKVLFNSFRIDENNYLKSVNYDFNYDFKKLIEIYKEDTLNTDFLIYNQWQY